MEQNIRLFTSKIAAGKVYRCFQENWEMFHWNPVHFDVIVTIEVFEHLRNPLNETILFNKMLRDGGALYLTTPNFNALSVIFWKELVNYLLSRSSFLLHSEIIKPFVTKKWIQKKYLITEGISVERIRQYLRKRKGNAPLRYQDKFPWILFGRQRLKNEQDWEYWKNS